jgi:hypothetical protein
LENNPQLRAPHTEHIRSIKPEFFCHEGVAALSPLARLVWIGLWTQADRLGRFPWRPAWLKTKILPYETVDFTALLDELLAAGFIIRYASDGDEYGCIVHWSRHQGLGTREKASKFSYPAPPSADADEVTAPARNCTHLQDGAQHSTSTVPAQCTHSAMSLGVGVGVGVGVEVGVGEGENTTATTTATALSLPKPVQPKSTPSGHKRTAEQNQKILDRIIERTKTLSGGKAGFTKTAKLDMLAAIAECGDIPTHVVDRLIKVKLKLCRDDDPVSYTKFGTDLASDWVASVRSLTARDAKQAERDAEEQDYAVAENVVSQYIAELDEVAKGDADIDAWLATHPAPEERQVCRPPFDERGVAEAITTARNHRVTAVMVKYANAFHSACGDPSINIKDWMSTHTAPPYADVSSIVNMKRYLDGRAPQQVTQ